MQRARGQSALRVYEGNSENVISQCKLFFQKYGCGWRKHGL